MLADPLKFVKRPPGDEADPLATARSRRGEASENNRLRARARVRVRVRVRLRQGGGEHLVDALAPGGSGQRAQLRVEQRALQRHDRRVAHLIKG